MSKTKFLSQVFKSGGTIGALSPSSSYLAEKMIKPIHFKNANCIVEFGPGTGIFTHKLLEKMKPDALLLIFEINPTFHDDLLKIDDKRLVVINDSAEKLEYYLHLHHQQKADYIISSLPFAMIPEVVVEAILEKSFQVLSDKGKYIQFQYSLNALSKLKKIFKKVDLSFTFLNIPPAFVFTCGK